MTINLLPEELINKIAAGEVIENQGAIIKELIENSIDAKSTKIEIELENYGFNKIVIKDNGVGISKIDLPLAPVRHATSKISNFNDLYSIKTLGFRGEALASIFAVAKVKLISKTKEDEAYEITNESIDEPKISGNQNGTTIIIEDIFYNVPARKKYLKSETLELKNVIEIVNRFTISNPKIEFFLKHNNKLLIHKPKFDGRLENIRYCLDSVKKEKILEINEKRKEITTELFLLNPLENSNSYKKDQYIFVNGRFIKSKLISQAIYDGIGNKLMIGRHPSFVLFIELDPEIIDVNIHPTKIEIKFENEMEIYELIKNTTKKLFEKEILYKDFEQELKTEKQTKLVENAKESIKQLNSQKKNDYFAKERQSILGLREEISKFGVSEDKQKISPKFEVSNETQDTSKWPLYGELKNYRIIGQMNKTYIFVEVPTEFLIIDQHAAEEKYNFEKYFEQLNAKQIATQKLVSPQIIRVTISEMQEYETYKELFMKLGFEIESFGNTELLLKKIPLNVFGKELGEEDFKNILYEISVNKIRNITKETLEKIACASCKNSIKAGKELTTFEMKEIIEKLRRTKEPFNCPHGRPIILRFSFQELEKKFKRIV